MKIRTIDSIDFCGIAPPDKALTQRAVLFSLLLGGLDDGIETTKIKAKIISKNHKSECQNVLIIKNPSVCADAKSAVFCIKKLGARVRNDGEMMVIFPPNIRKLRLSKRLFRLNAGNSATTLRLLAGILSGLGVRAKIDGDRSLRARNMGQLLDVLHNMGAEIDSKNQKCPLFLRSGAGQLRAVDFVPKSASAQIKSAVILAGLGANGATSVRESVATRDHTERMLTHLGFDVVRKDDSVTVFPAFLGDLESNLGESTSFLTTVSTSFLETDVPFLETDVPFLETDAPFLETKSTSLSTTDSTSFLATEVPFLATDVPFLKTKSTSLSRADDAKNGKKMVEIVGDISSCAFMIALGLVQNNSQVKIKNVGLNPLRMGMVNLLINANANIKITNLGVKNGEPFGEILAVSSKLNGFNVDAKLDHSLIDEIPILAVIACFCAEKSVFFNLSAIKNKESDRMSETFKYLKMFGAKADLVGDTLTVYGGFDTACGRGGLPKISSSDHRIVMAFSVLGALRFGCVIKNPKCVRVSYPDFFADLLGKKSSKSYRKIGKYSRKNSHKNGGKIDKIGKNQLEFGDKIDKIDKIGKNGGEL